MNAQGEAADQWNRWQTREEYGVRELYIYGTVGVQSVSDRPHYMAQTAASFFVY
jgi:hypothetical protein